MEIINIFKKPGPLLLEGDDLPEHREPSLEYIIYNYYKTNGIDHKESFKLTKDYIVGFITEHGLDNLGVADERRMYEYEMQRLCKL